MLLRFAFLKKQRFNGSTWSPSSAVTTFLETRNAQIDPLGGSGVNAPSTLITDDKGSRYFLAKAYSTVNAVITAVTGTDQNTNLL